MVTSRTSFFANFAQSFGFHRMVGKLEFGHHVMVGAIVIAFCHFVETSVFAGGGPENVLVVVNRQSWASQTIANYFCACRKIPPTNVVYLDWKKNVTTTDINTFRNDILGRVLKNIERHKLGQQIDYIVYSSDFPYAVSFHGEHDESDKFPTASITGLTYLAPYVVAKRPHFRQLNINWHMRPWRMSPNNRVGPIPESYGFRTVYGWSNQGKRMAANGQHYILSTMLGYTSGRGNSVSEVIKYLLRSEKADGTFPAGTIYFTHNDGIRSKVRDFTFGAVRQELRQRGVRSQIIDDQAAIHKHDVQGMVLGRADFDWAATGNKIQAGAICENFTSFGGMLRENAGQTPLTEFLRFGAAASSGTVTEPFSILYKFPHPMIHVHYARGCTLAEAYYQSVHGPYQLLIVGDPLCRPSARIPRFRVDGIKKDQTVQGTIEITPTVESSSDISIQRYDFFLTGRHMGSTEPGKSWQLDTTNIMDGYHELRVVGIEDSLVESQGRKIIPFVVDNFGGQVNVVTQPEKTVGWNETISITADAVGMNQLVVLQNRRVLGKLSTNKGRITIDAKRLGMGPVTLSVVGMDADNSRDYVTSKPIHFHVKPPHSAAPVSVSAAEMIRGIKLYRGDGSSAVLDKTVSLHWPTERGMTPGETYRMEGYTQVRKEDVHQVQVAADGKLELLFDGQLIYTKTDSNFDYNYIPISLRPGWHHLQIRGTLGTRARVYVAFGGPGAYAVGARQFQCTP